MKRIIFIILAIPMLSFSQNRQGGKVGERYEKIQTAKIGLITESLNLTPEQAPQFWSVYNELQSKKFELRRNIRKALDDANSLTSGDDKITEAHKQAIALRKREVELEDEYMTRLLKTITPKQYAELKRTEQSFNKKLIEKLKE